MKKLSNHIRSKQCFLFVVLAFVGCNSSEEIYPKYEYSIDYYVPDSIMPEAREWITETIRAASQNMSGGDYERPWVTIRKCTEEGLKLFGIRAEGLKMIPDDYGYNDEFLPPERMTCVERVIFDSVRKKCK